MEYELLASRDDPWKQFDEMEFGTGFASGDFLMITDEGQINIHLSNEPVLKFIINGYPYLLGLEECGSHLSWKSTGKLYLPNVIGHHNITLFNLELDMNSDLLDSLSRYFDYHRVHIVDPTQPPRYRDVVTQSPDGLSVWGVTNLFTVIDEGVVPYQILFSVQFPRDWLQRELLSPKFRYVKPQFVGNQKFDSLFVPAFEVEGKTREGYIPVAVTRNSFRIGHLYLRDGTFAPDDGIICIVLIGGKWQTRYFPKSLILNIYGEDGEEVYQEMARYAEQIGAWQMIF